MRFQTKKILNFIGEKRHFFSIFFLLLSISFAGFIYFEYIYNLSYSEIDYSSDIKIEDKKLDEIVISIDVRKEKYEESFEKEYKNPFK